MVLSSSLFIKVLDQSVSRIYLVVVCGIVYGCNYAVKVFKFDDYVDWKVDSSGFIVFKLKVLIFKAAGLNGSLPK